MVFVVVGLVHQARRALPPHQPTLSLGVPCLTSDGQPRAMKPFVGGLAGVVALGRGAQGQWSGGLAGVMASM